MPDTTASEAVPPPKKRTFFKKAAWQTAAKPEKEKDIFSHADTFKDIVAEEAKRKREAKEKAQAVKKRNPEDAGTRKKRKVSQDEDELKLPGNGGPESPSRTGRMGSVGYALSPYCADSFTDSNLVVAWHRFLRSRTRTQIRFHDVTIPWPSRRSAMPLYRILPI